MAAREAVADRIGQLEDDVRVKILKIEHEGTEAAVDALEAIRQEAQAALDRFDEARAMTRADAEGL